MRELGNEAESLFLSSRIKQTFHQAEDGGGEAQHKRGVVEEQCHAGAAD